MRKLVKIGLIITALLILANCKTESQDEPSTQTTAIQQLESDTLVVREAWTRPGAAGGNSAAYLTILNGRAATDTLLSIQTNAAKKAEIHRSFSDGDMAGMKPAGPLPIAPDSVLQLKPGGLHIMIIQLNRPLADGDSIRLDLQFTGAGKTSVTAPVKIGGG